MILNFIHGFCMAAADSVPGVSGGTIAFILGFYDRFVSAIDAVFADEMAARRRAVIYLMKIAAGWVVGMAVCAAVLSGLFEKNIYFMCSMFMGLTAASIPFIAAEEKKSLSDVRFIPFMLAGATAVIGITALRGHISGFAVADFSDLKPLSLIYIFMAGTFAITAMILPGISGSSILLITGIYLPTIQAVHSLLKLQLNVLPGLAMLGLGIIAGMGLSIHWLSKALMKYRSQLMWLIMGLMTGSLYAVANGPACLDVPMSPVNISSFSLPAFVLGIAVLAALELSRRFDSENAELSY